MLKPTGIAFALYPVTDVARSRRFYEQTLGLKACAEMEFAPGSWWIEYDVGGPSALCITNFKLAGANHAPSPGIAIELSNHDEALAAVRAAGVPVTWGPNEFPVCHSFGIKDPDGNDLYLHQRKNHA